MARMVRSTHDTAFVPGRVRLTWSLWNYTWTPTGPGDNRLVVRAFDPSGVVQIQEEKASGPEGSSGYHQVTAKIAAA